MIFESVFCKCYLRTGAKTACLLVSFLVALCCAGNEKINQSAWFSTASGKPQKLTADKAGYYETKAKFPGSLLLYQEKDRRTLRPDKKFFFSKKLSFKVTVSGGSVRGNIFMKDKDGFWFQSMKDFTFQPGTEQTVSVRIPAKYGDLQPVGHRAAWSNLFAATMQVVGLSLYSSEDEEVTISCSPPILEGKREIAPLEVLDWQMPSHGEQYKRLDSRFNLSRQYFNPFDPDEIAIDVEVMGPEKRHYTFPAFYRLKHVFEYHFTQEIMKPEGSPFWEFRLNPRWPGKYRVRLVITDKSGEKPEVLKTNWRELEVEKSDRRGFVRASKKDHRFFEFDNGQWYFPFGLNIHTNIDRRSERSFKHGRMPDRGVRDYQDYFSSMHKNGMNAAEVWLAAWSCAIEWSSAIRFYHGLGRYNMANAEKFDRIMKAAEDNGIYLHITLDNHGKLSASSDQEWYVSPHYDDGEFAVANDAFLKTPRGFFSNPKALRYNRNRNRYIAARWGAETNIFGVELVSEVDLVTEFRTLYEDGSGLKWHQNTIKEFLGFDQGKHLMTSHVCGDYKRNLEYEKMFALPEFDYVVGDAYRSTKVHFVDQMRGQTEMLPKFTKPIMITEFGGTSQAGAGALVVGDIHCGNWAALFKQQAGAPLLWWHDFVHLNDYYAHYYGFSQYIKGIDPRGKKYQYKELKAVDYVLPEALMELAEEDNNEFASTKERYEKRIKSYKERLVKEQDNIKARVAMAKKHEAEAIELLGKGIRDYMIKAGNLTTQAASAKETALTKGDENRREKLNTRNSDQKLAEVAKAYADAKRAADNLSSKAEKAKKALDKYAEQQAVKVFNHTLAEWKKSAAAAAESDKTAKVGAENLKKAVNALKTATRNISKAVKAVKIAEKNLKNKNTEAENANKAIMRAVKNRTIAEIELSEAGKVTVSRDAIAPAEAKIVKCVNARKVIEDALAVELQKTSIVTISDEDRAKIKSLQDKSEAARKAIVAAKAKLNSIEMEIDAQSARRKSNIEKCRQKLTEAQKQATVLSVAGKKAKQAVAKAENKVNLLKEALNKAQKEKKIAEYHKAKASAENGRLKQFDKEKKALADKAAAELKKLIGNKNFKLIATAAGIDRGTSDSLKKKQLEAAMKAVKEGSEAVPANIRQIIDLYIASVSAVESAKKAVETRKDNIKKTEERMKSALQGQTASKPEVECLSMGNENEIYGWVFSRSRIYEYPKNEPELRPIKGCRLIFDYKLKPGKYDLRYFNTMTGQEYAHQILEAPLKDNKIKVPDFKIDLAFKILPVKEQGMTAAKSTEKSNPAK